MRMNINYSHLKPAGSTLEQALRSKLSEMGTLRLMPKTLALRAVQRQRAASTSARGLRSEQHGSLSAPITTFTKPSTSAHTPSFSVSMGQLAFGAGTGVDGGGHAGFGFGFTQEPQPDTEAKRTRLRAKKRAIEEETLLEEAIAIDMIMN